MLLEWHSKQCNRLRDHNIPSTITPSPEPLPITFPLTIRETNSQSFLKRYRSEADVDGDDSIDAQRKKRRLRFDLVTSRLSQPYATPTTHIITRKGRRPGPWVKPRSTVRSPLRRAAILNAIRKKRTPAKNFGPKEADLLTGLNPQKESAHTEVDLITQGVRTPRGPMPNEYSPQQHLLPSPSPLGPSNYDALDEDDDPFEDDAEGTEDGDTVYSNFNDLDGADTDIDDYDTPCSFGGDEDDFDSWSPETVRQPANVTAGLEQQVETLSASCAS